ncbi:hypothetical protein A2574_02430 [Candidatus Shapirobacteria bacterium RIFOXYD1_FULL_38_32]|uniref:Uncharacterized protein n=2 Tax=Candidatus Shapironibacteriota TaxID=1752721 RepID=A0A0G0JU68_9BACT|nr:MAG: hypothetical protein US90_C0004G0015 [Candidatus Shapirobacteria bacterium GW2011_GWE2_38_30]OGL56008.1 MAG: hypothetical protein A2195_01530 [Candidatus Shapirobacteria bacterium RIFOXYA1_FULL_39_17]OGL56211.1 MAG: hypothetical protein A2410_00135 [Candidatus Shapirobacteria bacterium RIFOXYC1_FULL_38_24]OGL57025.1 MAG: hypothetical protein A2367_00385 [Candidatus Shapirobacteria bacterium RIFOXYB1_FULL_38_38]OGL58491.1 MAG: hypothetical protein A2574_02430 [Candidatus Shapirobacteria 
MIIVVFFILISAFLLFVSTAPVAAQCPVCIVTVGGGMFLAQRLGIDDLLVSIWISALNTAIAFYLAPKINSGVRRNKILQIFANPWILSILLYLTTILYFQFTNQLGVSTNKLLGFDKIFLGQTIGLLTMFAGNYLYSYFKTKNGNKALFPYSKVVFPVGMVLLITLIFKFSFNL